MNNGVYTVFANDGSQVSSGGLIEFGIGVPNQKVLVFSGIAMPEMDTNDDDDVGNPRVFVRLGRFVRKLVSSTVVVGLASIANDESGFVLATDSVAAQQDPQSGELFLDISCGLSGNGTWIHRIGYQAVCVIEEDTIRIRGEISWPLELRDATNDTAITMNSLLIVHSGRLKNVTPPDPPPNTFGTNVWEAFSNGRITDLNRRGDSWVATYEILNLPVLTPISVIVDVQPGSILVALILLLSGKAALILYY